MRYIIKSIVLALALIGPAYLVGCEVALAAEPKVLICETEVMVNHVAKNADELIPYAVKAGKCIVAEFSAVAKYITFSSESGILGMFIKKTYFAGRIVMVN